MKQTTLYLFLSAVLATSAGLLASDIGTNIPQRSIVVMSMLNGNARQLQEYILKQENVVLLFYGEHCPPCQRFKPIYSRVANSEEFASTVVFIEVSAVEYASIRNNYGVNKWPTVIYLKHGREMRRDVRRDDLSFISEEIFKQHVRELIAAR